MAPSVTNSRAVDPEDRATGTDDRQVHDLASAQSVLLLNGAEAAYRRFELHDNAPPERRRQRVDWVARLALHRCGS